MLRKIGTGVVAICMAAGFSMVACGDDDSNAVCGDNVLEGGEVCDGVDLGGRTCADEGFAGGVLGCSLTCDSYDTSACNNDVCGDGVITGNEDCEGTDLNNTTCEDLNYDGGTLACSDTCTFDESGCFMNCTDECPAEGDTQCTGDVLGTCTVGTDGCLDWVDTDCTDTGQTCDDSGATAACVDGCTSDCPAIGDTECIDATNLNTCEDGGDGCMYWTASECTGGYCDDTAVPPACVVQGTGDSCQDALVVQTFPAQFTGTDITADYADDHDFTGTSCGTGNGVEAVFAVDMLTGEILTLDETGGLDAVIRVLDTCDATGECLVSSDFPETGLYFVAPADGLYHVVLEAYFSSPSSTDYDFTLDLISPVCGDGVIDLGEQCDDSDTTAGDGCDANCQVEPGYDCIGEPSVCTFLCGNSTIDATTNEGCDDGNTTAGDGCDASCQVEPGWGCTGEPSTCTSTCGSGTIEVATHEQCDDGNTTAGDGCDASCQVESGYICAGEPSTCTAVTQVDYAQTGLALAITDDGYDGTLGSMSCVTFAVPSTGADTVGSAQVQIAMDHTWIGDLVIKVVSPANTVTTILSRPGLAETVDDGSSCCGDSSNLVVGSPVTFADSSANDAEAMGAVAIDVCLDDGICDFSPNPGAGPGTNGFYDFNAESTVGTWQVCFGDSGAGDTGTVDSVTLSLLVL